MSSNNTYKPQIHKLVDGTYAGGGGGGVDFSSPVDDNLIIDVDDTEALLVRKDGDLGDIFRVDTVNEIIEYKDGNQSAGYVLTSDANGIGTWQTPSSASQVVIDDGSLTLPSIRFLNDTDMGIHRPATGEFNFVKGGAPVLTIDNGEATVNSTMNSRHYSVGNVTYTSPASLGTVIAYYDFDTDVFTDQTGAGFDFTTAVGTTPTITVLLSGRSNVMRIIKNVSCAVYTEDTTNIAAIQGLTDFFVSFRCTAPGFGHTTDVWSFHNGTDVSTATDYIRCRTSGASIIFSIKKAGSVIYTSSALTSSSLAHFVIQFSTTNGIEIWNNNVSVATSPSTLESLSTIPITRWVLGSEAVLQNSDTYVDTVVLVSGNADNTKVDDLFNDSIGFAGTAVYAQHSRLTYDTNDGKTKVELLPSGDDVWTADATEMEVVKSLKYTGDTPVLNSVLKTDASGSLTYDTVNNLIVETTVDHDNLLNYVANEHIDWTSTSSNFSTSGTTTLTGALQYNVSPTDGYVLTSDGSGNATWSATAGLPTETLTPLPEMDAVYISPEFFMNFKDTNGSFLEEGSHGYDQIINTGVTDGTNIATLTGTSSWLEMWQNTDFVTNVGTITEATFGVRFKQTANDAGVLITIIGSTGRMNLDVTSGGTITIFVDNGTSYSAEATGTNYADSTFHYVLMTLGTGGNTMYIDGSAVSLTYSTGSSASTEVVTNPIAISIGTYSTAGFPLAPHPACDMDRVFFSSHKYSAGEITALNSFSGTDYYYLDGDDGLVASTITTLKVDRFIQSSMVRYHSTTQSIVFSTGGITVELDTPTYKSGSDITFNNVTNTFTLGSAGLYQFSGQVVFAGGSGTQSLCFKDNATPTARCYGRLQRTSAGNDRFATSCVLYYDGLNPSSYEVVMEVSNTGSTMNIGVVSSELTYCSVVKIN